MDYKIVYFLNHLGQGTIVDSLSYYYSWVPFLIAFWFFIALIVLLFDLKNGKWVFLSMIFIVVVYYILNDLIIKQSIVSIFFRERPYLAFPNTIISSGETFRDSSFPSGHMSLTTSLVALYMYYYRKRWVWVLGILLIIMMAYSRIHNGMHYPTDVLAGIIFGVGYGFLAIYLINVLKKERSSSA